jgi:hypothetical protein
MVHRKTTLSEGFYGRPYHKSLPHPYPLAPRPSPEGTDAATPRCVARPVTVGSPTGSGALLRRLPACSHLPHRPLPGRGLAVRRPTWSSPVDHGGGPGGACRPAMEAARAELAGRPWRRLVRSSFATGPISDRPPPVSSSPRRVVAVIQLHQDRAASLQLATAPAIFHVRCAPTGPTGHRG